MPHKTRRNIKERRVSAGAWPAICASKAGEIARLSTLMAGVLPLRKSWVLYRRSEGAGAKTREFQLAMKFPNLVDKPAQNIR